MKYAFCIMALLCLSSGATPPDPNAACIFLILAIVFS